MRLEGWHVILIGAMLLLAAVAVVAVTLIVRWTVRRATGRDTPDGSGSAEP